MAEEFDIIAAFLRRFEPAAEVLGRGLEPDDARAPTAEFTEKLGSFARGECTPEERRSLCQLLDARRDWVEQLARIVRGLAPTTAQTPPPTSPAGA